MKELVEKGTVYILNACHKDNDDEVIGCFASMNALLTFFARMIAEEHKNEAPSEIIYLVATLTKDLLGQGSANECRDGRTRYWYSELEILGFEEG